MKLQIGTSKEKGRGGRRRTLPYAFTEQGVAMLSGVLRSKRAVRVNIEIVGAFARLREILASNKDFARRLEDLERKFNAHDHQFQAVFDAIRELMKEPEKLHRVLNKYFYTLATATGLERIGITPCPKEAICDTDRKKSNLRTFSTYL